MPQIFRPTGLGGVVVRDAWTDPFAQTLEADRGRQGAASGSTDGQVASVAAMSMQAKIASAILRSLPMLPSAARGSVEAMLSPVALSIAAGTLAAWAGSHFFGFGWLVDAILLAVGVGALGVSALQGAQHLYRFVTTVMFARTAADLDQAASHFAQAVLILGIGVVTAVLLRRGVTKSAPPRAAPAPTPANSPPMPYLTRPPAALVQSVAEKAARGEALSSAESELLLTQTTVDTRLAILARRNYMAELQGRPPLSLEEGWSPQSVSGSCGLGQDLSNLRLRELGVNPDKIFLHQAADAFPGPDTYRHAFSVVQMPDGKSYLVDTTLQQFFDSQRTAMGQLGYPGQVMRGLPGGQAVADQLLEKGFIPLSDDVANIYGQALSSGTSGQTFGAGNLMTSTTSAEKTDAALRAILGR